MNEAFESFGTFSRTIPNTCRPLLPLLHIPHHFLMNTMIISICLLLSVCVTRARHWGISCVSATSLGFLMAVNINDRPHVIPIDFSIQNHTRNSNTNSYCWLCRQWQIQWPNKQYHIQLLYIQTFRIRTLLSLQTNNKDSIFHQSISSTLRTTKTQKTWTPQTFRAMHSTAICAGSQ